MGFGQALRGRGHQRRFNTVVIASASAEPAQWQVPHRPRPASNPRPIHEPLQVETFTNAPPVLVSYSAKPPW